MVNSFHLLLAALQLRVYFEWVPLEANTSDLPSHVMETGAMETYFQYFPTSQRDLGVRACSASVSMTC